MTLTRAEVLKILRVRHIEPDTLMRYDIKTEMWDMSSSFDATFGHPGYYNLMEVKRWLGE